jgi:hypothetical protein
MVLDSDDTLHETALARLGAALDSGGAVASYGQCRIISEDGQFIGQLYRPRRGYPPSGDVLAFVPRNLSSMAAMCVSMVQPRARSAFSATTSRR